MANILLGVSGSVAAYKAVEFVRQATLAGHAVRVVQTPASLNFIGQATFAAVTGSPVLVSEFERDPLRGVFPGAELPEHDPIGHLALVDNADIMIVAPASANTVAKLASGTADNLLTACALASTCPLVVAPAMNNQMYLHPATQANLQRLREHGATVIDPDTGRLASKGEWGVGRLPEPGVLLGECEKLLAVDAGSTAELAGVRILVTAGGTREAIDSVRFVGNRSSGKMGFALAAEAASRGAEVTVIAANVDLPRSPGVEYVEVVTAAELEHACRERFPRCDVLLMAAAVADYRPASPAEGKIKKDRSSVLDLKLERTADVLCALSGRRSPGQLLIGFAAEHGEDSLTCAERKLVDKGLDAVIFNDIGRADIGFESEDNEVTVVTASGHRHFAKTGKTQLAAELIDLVVDMR